MLAGELVRSMNFVITLPTERGLVGTTQHLGLGGLADVALYLHFRAVPAPKQFLFGSKGGESEYEKEASS